VRASAALRALVAATLLITALGAANAQDTSGGGAIQSGVSGQGRQIYEQICQACHMADALGGSGAGAKIPALADDTRLADPKYPISMVLEGRGGMPSFAAILTPAQIAAVITYIRSHFNHYPDAVSEAEVKRFVASSAPSPH